MPAFVVQKDPDGKEYILADEENNYPFQVPAHDGYEKTTYRVLSSTGLTPSSTDRQYPSAKLVYNELQKKLNSNQGAANAGKIIEVRSDGTLGAADLGGKLASDRTNILDNKLQIKEWIILHKDEIKEILGI